LADRHELSRLKSRSIEFACLALVAGTLAMTTFGAVEDALGDPLAEVRKALN